MASKIGRFLAAVLISVITASLANAQWDSGLPQEKSGAGAEYRRLGPKATNDFYDFEEDRELEEVTDQAIEELSRLSERFRRSPNRGEIWLRLAEQYVEKARLIEAREQNRFQKVIDDYNKNPKGAVPEMELTEVREYNIKAANLYKKFVREFRKDPRVDQALFFLGYTYFELERVNEGAKFYRMLTERFPNSRYISESSFALAEYHFEKDEWRSALKYYRLVAKDRNARLYIFALYKAAWCFYRVNRIDKAFDVMERVLYESRIAKQEAEIQGRKKVNRLLLASEAMRDLIPFYADSKGKHTEAYEYFRRVGGRKQVAEMVERLAYYYADTGRKNEARYLFKQLIEKNPDSPRAFEYQYQIVNNYIASGQVKILRNELNRWIKDYSKDSEWGRRNKKNKKMLSDAEKVREAALRNFVLQVHQTAKNSRQAFSQKMAKDGYELYFKAFPGAPKQDMMQYYFGDLLLDMKLYGPAAKQYLWVIRNAPKSAYAEPAMVNSAIALEKQLPSDKEIIKRVGKTTKPVAFGPKIRLFEKAGRLYLKRFPEGNRRDRIRFKIARLHYLHNSFDPALEGFKRVAKDSPKTLLGEYSANLILDIYKIRKDYSSLQKEGKSLIGSGLSDKVEGEIQAIVEESSFKSAESLEKDKKYVESAKAYEAFAKANPGSKLAISALFNAGINFSRGGQALSALSILGTLASPRSKANPKMQRQANEKMVDLYIQTAQYRKAALLYERFYSIYQKDPKRPLYAYNAAVIWDGLNEWTAAIRNYRKYFDTDKKKKREEALFAIAEIKRKQGRRGEAMRAYQEYLAQNPASAENTVTSNFHVARLQDLTGDKENARKNYWKTIAVHKAVSKKKKVGLRYAAEARFRIALPKYEDFISITLPSKASEQKKALDKKLAAMKVLKKEITEVVKLGDGGQIVASFTILGKANLNYGEFFTKAPLPKGLNKAEQAEYRKQLAKQAEPLNNAAQTNFLKAIENSQKFQSYNVWVQMAKSGLSKIDGRKFYYDGFPTVRDSEIDWMGI